MIRDVFEPLETAVADVTIIGAGPVGLALALELDRLGLSVTILEAGTRTRDRSVQELSDAELISSTTHDPLAAASARMLGGTSNLWAGGCIPYDPIDTKARGFVSNVEWPIEYHELLPFYEPACHYLDAGGSTFSVAAPTITELSDEFTINNLVRFAKQRRAQVVHADAIAKSERLDLRLNAIVTGVTLSEAGTATSLHIAKPDGSARARLNVRNLVIAGGGLETTRLLLNMQKDRPSLFGGGEGPLGRFYMGHLTGTIADIRFAQSEYADLFDFTVDHFQTITRRRFHVSERTQLKEGLLNTSLWPEGPIADARHGNALFSAIYLMTAGNQFVRALLPEVMRRRHSTSVPGSLKQHFRNLKPSALGSFGKDASLLLRRFVQKPRPPGFFIKNKDHNYRLTYHAEHMPHSDSRVTLSRSCDRLGVNQISIDLRFKAEDARSVVRVHELLSRWLLRSGFANLSLLFPPEALLDAVLKQACHGTHQIGTTRMASSAKNGPVDKDLRCFDVANLYVCSSSVLPTSSQANPTLTAVALAVRLARHLAKSTR